MQLPSLKDIYSIAYHYYQSGLYQEAEACFHFLAGADVYNVHHWMGLAAALKMQKKYQAAYDAYSAAAIFEDSETDPYPHFYAAECLFSLGDLDRAQKALLSAKIIANKDKSHIALLEKINLLKQSWKPICQV